MSSSSESVLSVPSGEEKKDGAKTVDIAIYLNNMGQIDAATGICEVDFYLRYRWKDEHVNDVDKSEPPDLANDKKFWDPCLEVLNKTELDEVGTTSLIDGDYVCKEVRFRGGVLCEMILDQFPFDSQVVKVILESYEHNETKLLFSSWNNFSGDPFNATVDRHPEFEIMSPSNDVGTHTYPYSLVEGDKEGESFSQYTFSLAVQRKAGYYNSKIASVFAMMVICSWTTFFMSPDDIGNRLGILTTMFLTAVAFQYVVNEKLPNIPYLTKMDRLVNGCYILLLLAIVETVIVFQANLRGKDDDWCFGMDMTSFAVLGTPAVLLGLWFLFNNVRHTKRVKVYKQSK